MRSPFCMKVCTKCGELLVANNMNFTKCKTGKYGLQGQCKRCRNKQSAEYHQSNKEKRNKQSAEYYQNNKEKKAEYYKTNKESIEKQQSEYRKNNKEKKSKYDAEYYQANKEKITKQKVEYRKNNPDIVFNNSHKRRQREEFGPGISKEQWLEMMNFFDWKCAYSGESLVNNNRSIDHVVPLKNHGWNGIINCVPCTRSVNSSKCASDMIDWYKKQDFYSEDRLNKIYEWIEYSTNKYSEHIIIAM